MPSIAAAVAYGTAAAPGCPARRATACPKAERHHASGGLNGSSPGKAAAISRAAVRTASLSIWAEQLRRPYLGLDAQAFPYRPDLTTPTEKDLERVDDPGFHQPDEPPASSHVLCRTRMVHLTNNSKYLAEHVKEKGNVVPGLRTRLIGAVGGHRR